MTTYNQAGQNEYVGRYAAHDLSDAALGGPLGVRHGHFVDSYGRTVSLRGFNIAGASKMPSRPDGRTHRWDPDTFYRHRVVDFCGRPFPLRDAPLHFRRLRAWGMPLIRLLVTWESIAHSGPDPKTDLDLDYMAYLHHLVTIMSAYGLKCFVCAHQDVWSRFCGGSGAPGWTLEAAGLDITAFADTAAAYIHGQDEACRRRRDAAPPTPVKEQPEPGGPFVWPSGNQKLAASTMATLFWAGAALAPQLRCLRFAMPRNGGDGTDHTEELVSVQTFLQDAFIEAFGRLADQLGPLEACLGFEPINEPDRGLVNLHSFDGWNYNTDLHIGFFPSLLQSLALGSGHAQSVPFYVKSWPWPTRLSHHSLVDPAGRCAWLPPAAAVVNRPRGMGGCVWRKHGVWRWDAGEERPVVLQREYFDRDHRPGCEGRRIDWYRDCYAPFVLRFAERTSRLCRRQHHPKTLLSFVEPLPNQFMPPWPGADAAVAAPTEDRDRLNGAKTATVTAAATIIASPRPPNFVFAPHFYDLNILFNKAHTAVSVNVQGLARGMSLLHALYFGAKGLRDNYRTQLAAIVSHARATLRHPAVPLIIGEIGIPFDIDRRRALATGDYDSQRELMHALISAMEDNRLGFTLWNYNPANTAVHGDGWNDEDFSVVSRCRTSDENDDDDDAVMAVADYRNQAHRGDELYDGGRTLDMVIRPYAVKVAGLLVRSHWDPRTLRYELEWQSSANDEVHVRVTEVFIPDYHYAAVAAAHELSIELSDGEWSLDSGKQSLYVCHEPAHGGSPDPIRHRLVVTIHDLRRHMLSRVIQRRDAFPPRFPWSAVPPAVEVWADGLTFNQILLAGSCVVVLTLAVVVAMLA